MKKLLTIVFTALMLFSVVLSIEVLADTNLTPAHVDNDETKEVIEAKNRIGKELYSRATSLVSRALRVSGFEGKIASEKEAPEEAIEVRYNQETNEYAAIIKVPYTYKLDGNKFDHNMIISYRGVLDGKTVKVNADHTVKNSKEISQFWETWMKENQG